MPRTDIRTPRPTLILIATISSAILVVANVSSLNVALPQLSRELGATQADVHWMVDIYAVFLAALLLPAGALGDRFGRRRMLLLGIVVLIGSNAATLLMDSPMPVIIGRAVSGVGAAFVFPATLSTITSTLPSDQRGRGVAIWTAAVSIGGILGVMGSGLLIENFWWGSVFLAMTIASAIVLAACWFFVPDSSDPDEANLDPLGALLSFVAVGGLVLGVIEGPVEGWTSLFALLGLVVGGAALVGFVVWEWRNPRPLLDVRLFAERGIRSGSLSIFVQFAAAFGFFFLTVPYLAFVLGYGPLKIGLGLLPVAIGLFPASAAAIPLTRRFGRKVIGIIGLLILASGFVLGTFITVDTDFLLFAAMMVVFGLGLGLSSPPATEAIVEALPPAKQGVASALNDVLREFGAAIGIATIGSAFNGGYRATIDDLVGFPEEIVEAVRETPAAAAVIAPDLGPAGADLLSAVATAVVDGWSVGLWLTAIMVIIGAAGFGVWAPRKSSTRAVVSNVAAEGRAVSEVTTIRVVAEHEQDLIDLERSIATVNAHSAAEIGMHLQTSSDADEADVVIAMLGTDADTDVLYEIARLSRHTNGYLPPDVLVFTGEPYGGLFAVEESDVALSWLFDAMQAGTAQIVAIDSTEDSHRQMTQAFVHRIDRWADRHDSLALAPRLGLGDLELTAPLGAIEIASAAEADVARLSSIYQQLRHTIDLVTTRSAVSPELDTWAATQQTIVAERAALAVNEPLQELVTLCERALERTISCDSLVTGAHTELRRLGQPEHPLNDLRNGCAEANNDADAVAQSLRVIADRFEELATLRSTLRPSAGQLCSASTLASRAHQITQSWAQTIDLAASDDLANNQSPSAVG